MSASGNQLGLRLFLEGLEVPVVAAQVQIGINAPATASIQVVPGDKITELKARTMVHLFFWDYTQDNLQAPTPPDPARVALEFDVSVDEAKDIIADNPGLFETPVDQEMRGYKLLFSGEVIGVVMMKTPSGRQAVLQCSDFSTYWDTTYQFFVSYSPGGNFLGTSAAVWAGSDSMFDDLTAGHTSVMNEYLTSRPQTEGLKNVKGLMGGIIALLEAMGGVPNHTHGINDFFTIAELKNHILQQIVAEQNDDTAQRLFDEKAFSQWLSNGMSSLGQLTTFRDMMKLLFNFVYYEVVPNPAAMYVQARRKDVQKKQVSQSSRVEIPAELLTGLQPLQIQAGIFEAHTFVEGPFDEDKYARTFKKDLASLANASSMPKVYKSKLEKAYTWLDGIKEYFPKLELQVAVDTGNSSQLVNTPGNSLAHKVYDANRKAWGKVEGILSDVLGQNSRFSSVATKVKVTPAELDQLHTQIFRPDCFFAAPPKCNVLFPDQYTQFQFSRNFLQETTRLRLSVDWLFGGDSGGLLAEYHFAPATDEIQKLSLKQGNDGLRALLPWEIYSGILPKFESIHEMNYVAGQAERRRGIKGNIKGAAVNYAQRTANFNFFKYRFASRTCEVSAKFNPFLICGFPALIIERPFIVQPDVAAQVHDNASTITNGLNPGDMGLFVKLATGFTSAPKQYLGMIAALSHSVQQDGASTSVTLTHARTHRITDDDFLHMYSTEVSKQLQKSVVSTPLNADELLRKGDWRKLKFLIDATPQTLDQQAQAADDQSAEIDDNSESPPVEDRPDGFPNLAGSTAQFGSLLTPPTPTNTIKVSVPSTQTPTDPDTATLPLRGNVKKDRLKGTRQVILVPDPGGNLAIGSTGPQGGKIVQIQCVSDAAMGIVGKTTTQRLKKGQNVTITSGSIIDEVEKDPTTGKFVLKGNVVNNGDVTFMWKSIIIHEEVTTTKKETTLLPIEESIRPPWFSPLYSNWFIGDEIYTPFFGCGSIVDQALFLTGNGAVTFGTGRAQQEDILNKLKAAGNDKQAIMNIIADAKAKNITDVPDIESSVDVLAYIYGETRRLGLDVHKFINDYTYRPIATMEDILGSADLQYEIQNNKTLKLVKGTPGFHSSAIADVGGQLIGLLDNPDLELSRLRKGAGKKSPVSRDLDPRPGRRAKVLEYLQEINASTGSLGVGIEG